MSSQLSIFAARVRDHIGVCAADFGAGAKHDLPGWAEHADAEFNGLALMLFTLQFESNHAYRKLCLARGLRPDVVHHWTNIPAMPAAAFKEFELSCLHPESRTHVFYSSGTTTQKHSRHFHNAESLSVYEASLWAWFDHNVCGRFPSGNLTLLAPPPIQSPHSSLVHMFDFIRRKLGANGSAFHGDVESDGSWALNLETVVRELSSDSKPGTRNPELVLGTAFSFVHLLDHLAEKNLRFSLPPGSIVMETGGYKGRSRSMPKDELHALISHHLGVPRSYIICEYGMSELSSQAYDGEAQRAECGAGNGERVFRFPPWARAQIISPETGREVADGETGLLRVCDLANVFSVLAIQTEDVAVRRGDGFELIGRAPAAEQRGCSLMAN